MEEIKIIPKSINDYKISYNTWKCEKCNTVFQYPSNQHEGLECPFCKISLKKCDPTDPLYKELVEADETLNENKPNKKVFLLIKRGEKGKILDIKEVDKETYEKANDTIDQNPASQSIIAEQDNWKAIEVELENIHPFNINNSFCNDAGFKIVIYKQNDYCGITKILNEMITMAINNFHNLFDKDVSIELIIVKADKKSYLNKSISLYPQITIFYHGEVKDFYIDHLPIKELNEETFLNHMIYWNMKMKKVLSEV